MITIKLKYKATDNNVITNYIKQYNSCVHIFYNLLQKETSLLPLNKYITNNSVCIQKFKQLNNVDLINSWLLQCAIKEAYSLAKKSKNIIFYGKSNFIRRCKGLISRDEFLNNKKYLPLNCIGSGKPYKGNRFFELTSDLDKVIFKPNRKTKIILNIQLQNRTKIIQQLFQIQESKLHPISYKLSHDFIYIIFDEIIINTINYHNYINNRVMSIDMNPNYIGWSIIDWKKENKFNIVKSGLISIKHLNDIELQLKGKGYNVESKERKYLTNKRNHEVIEIVKNLVNKTIYYKCQLFVIENLQFENKDSGKGKKTNHLINNCWNRNMFIKNLEKRCNIFKVKLLKVKPDYSSFIGNFLFRSLKLPDPVLASIEISRRGYEFFNQYISKTKNIKKNIIQPEIKQFRDFYIKSLEEFNICNKSLDFIQLYYIFKKSKMMYRLSMDKFKDLQFSRFLTHKSRIDYIEFKNYIEKNENTELYSRTVLC